MLLNEITAVWSGDTTNSCENDSKPRKIPQIDSDSRSAVEFVTRNVSETEIFLESVCFGSICCTHNLPSFGDEAVSHTDSSS